MPDLPTLTTSFNQLQTWARKHAPTVTFRPPADPAVVENFAAKSGLTLPDSLREALRIADGETRASSGMIGNWRLLPLAEIQGAWGLLTQLAEKGAFVGLEPETPPYLRNVWWHPGWIPIVASGSGDFFCLDTAPPEAARTGQVVLFLQGRPERPLIAGGWRAWWDRIARDLESGVYTYHEETGFNGEAFLWSALQGKHLLDGRNGKRVVVR